MLALSVLSFSLYVAVAVASFVLGILFAAPVERDLAKAEADLEAEVAKLHAELDTLESDVKKKL